MSLIACLGRVTAKLVSGAQATPGVVHRGLSTAGKEFATGYRDVRPAGPKPAPALPQKPLALSILEGLSRQIQSMERAAENHHRTPGDAQMPPAPVNIPVSEPEPVPVP